MLEDTGFGYEGMKTRVSLIISINFKVHILYFFLILLLNALFLELFLAIFCSWEKINNFSRKKVLSSFNKLTFGKPKF